MKKLSLLSVVFCMFFTLAKSQVNEIDFGTTNALFICDPPVYGTTGQSQCVNINPVVTPSGFTFMYSTTATGLIGADCRNWLRLLNPGLPFIGSGSELEIRNASNGSTPFNPARFLVKNFTPGLRFGISFDIALAGYGGEFIFRCGSGQTYGDSINMLIRDTSSFMMMKVDDNNPALSQPFLVYSSSLNNPVWPNPANFYYWTPGLNSSFPVYQKHTVAIFCNNTDLTTSYEYIGIKSLNPQSYDVYLDSILDVSNMFDSLFGLNRNINSFMFCGGNSRCANGGDYLGDTLAIDNIRWTSDFIASPLSVHLSSFIAQPGLEKEVVLNWRNEAPEDNFVVKIQVSSDGRNFRNIGEVVERRDKKDYSFVYQNKDCGKLYFRLKFDGDKYSDVKVVVVPCDVGITSYKKYVQVNTKYSGILTILNIQGQLVLKKAVSAGHTEIPVIVPVGFYVANFITNGEVYTKKVYLDN